MGEQRQQSALELLLGVTDSRPSSCIVPELSVRLRGWRIRHGGVGVGNTYLAKSDPGQEDEETLVMFASQAAFVIANARRHRDERRARGNLETLIDTSPIGVVVFDARTAAPVSINRETRRILEELTAAVRGAEALRVID